MSFPTWEPARSCTGSVTQGARHLLAWARRAYPQGRSMGIYNCRSVVGGSTTSLHGEGRALDYGMPMTNGRGSAAGHRMVGQLRDNAMRLGVQAIIYDRQIWSARSPTGRRYAGAHPHFDHLHIELTWNAARNLNLATLFAVLGDSNMQAEDIQRALVDAGYDLGRFGPNNDGVDNDWGSVSQGALTQAFKDAKGGTGGVTFAQGDNRWVRKGQNVKIT